MDFFAVYAQVSISWAAFTGIVATLRQAGGIKFTREQYVMFRFFTEGSLVLLMVAMVAMMILQATTDKELAARLLCIYTTLSLITYVPFHVVRRIKSRISMVLFSKLVVVGYAILTSIFLISLTDYLWQPSFILVQTVLLYGLATNSVIFFIFISSYVQVEGEL
ncbi:MAG: hypothetical protein ACI89D_001667, partial [Bermanella sp.]|jgi:hypothetical protein